LVRTSDQGCESLAEGRGSALGRRGDEDVTYGGRGLGIVGILVVVLIMLAIVYFLRRA
jgi:hypothetical protein